MQTRSSTLATTAQAMGQFARPWPAYLAVIRRSRRDLTWRRLLAGGRLSDAGRLPRYLAFFLFGAAVIWAPIVGYLKTAPLKYRTHVSLILPGSGASASVNLNNIGQASSYANSAFSSNAISPTETYKRLLGADRILASAAADLGIAQYALGKPRIELVDQTSLIRIEMTGDTPKDAQQRGEALLAAFFAELDALREDELKVRQDSGQGAIGEYQKSVQDIRAAISRLQAETGLLSVEQFDAQVTARDALETQTRDAAAALARQQATVATLEATLAQSAGMAAATLKLFADAEFITVKAELSAHAAKVADAQSHYGPRHPKVIEAVQAYEGAQARTRDQAMQVTGLGPDQIGLLDLAPDGARSDLLADLVRQDVTRVGLEREHAALADLLARETARLNALAPSAAELEDRQRDFAVAEAIFASAIARSQSTKTDVYASYPLVQVLENPSLPDAPSSPRRKLALAAAIAATMMLAVGLALGWIRRVVITWLIGRRSGDGMA